MLVVLLSGAGLLGFAIVNLWETVRDADERERAAAERQASDTAKDLRELLQQTQQRGANHGKQQTNNGSAAGLPHGVQRDPQPEVRRRQAGEGHLRAGIAAGQNR